jgi:hypothetical protein
MARVMASAVLWELPALAPLPWLVIVVSESIRASSNAGRRLKAKLLQ